MPHKTCQAEGAYIFVRWTIILKKQSNLTRKSTRFSILGTENLSSWRGLYIL
jgi:hypothetical protein